MMHGRIWFESEVNQGSQFHFTAQFEAAKAEPSSLLNEESTLAGLAVGNGRFRKPGATATEYSRRKDGRASGLRILLVDDDRVNQRLTFRTLEKQRHQVAVASDGLEALSVFETGSFDVILMDVQMPGMDGFEVTSRIRKNEENTGAHQQIIAMTAHALAGDRERCLAAGMDDYIAKPMRHVELTEALDKVRSELERVGANYQHAAKPYPVGYGLA
jgi:CheY-like chemotaxis protein